MGKLVDAFNWASTPLGARPEWSPALKAMAGVALASDQPMLLMWGPELIQIYNDAFSRTVGPERHPSALGQPGKDCWRETWPIIGAQIESIMAGGPAIFIENALVPITRHGAQQEVWWDYGYSPIPGKAGVDGVLVICTDVTAKYLATREQVRLDALLSAEVAQREYQYDRQKTMFQKAPGFMCILRGPTHVFEFANDAYVRLVGGRDVVGKSVDEVIPESSGQGFTELLNQVYRSGVAHSAQGLGIYLRNSPDQPPVRRVLDFVYQPISETDGSVSGIFVQGIDVTDRKFAENALVAAGNRKDEFLAMLAHELRNPLAPISSAAQLLKSRDPDARTVRMAGDVIHRQVNHLSSLVTDLLDASRLSRGQVELDLHRVDMAAVLSEAMEQIEPLVESRGQRMERTQSGPLACVTGDRKRLVQVVANLLGNAAKFTPVGGVLSAELIANESTDEVSLTVRDSGIGIEADLLPRIFERFAQGARSSDRTEGGMGIGLSLVKDIVQLHKGSVSATSAGLGQGSAFTVRLPGDQTRRPIPSQGLTFEIAPAPTTAPPSLRVLVVDDNVDAAELLALWLRVAGHDVRMESDSLSALDTARSFHPDLYLLDIGLPGLDGNQLARRLRDTSHGRDATLVAISGYGLETDRVNARDAGFDHYFVKPVDTQALATLIDRVDTVVGK